MESFRGALGLYPRFGMRAVSYAASQVHKLHIPGVENDKLDDKKAFIRIKPFVPFLLSQPPALWFSELAGSFRHNSQNCLIETPIIILLC